LTDDVEHFKNKYRATVSQGRMRYTVPKKFIMSQTQDWDMTFDTEYGVQIDMSQRDFENLVYMEKRFYETMERSGPYIDGHAKYIVEEHEREQLIRAENPSVRSAYEKYQTLLRMVDSYYD
jgi:hypothetical protein